MLGGGFLNQMNQTNKQNRDMLRKEKRKPFDKKDNISSGDGESLTDDKQLTDDEREILIKAIRLEVKKDEQKKLVVLMISFIATCLTLAIAYWLFADRLTEFLKR
jgi:hypothetical protein